MNVGGLDFLEIRYRKESLGREFLWKPEIEEKPKY